MRFPWSDPGAQCGQLVNRIMLKACRKGRYKTIEAVAAVVASLRRRGAVEVSIRLVDSVMEELRWALEHPNFRDQQRTITYARLLGELFCRGQVSGKLIIDQLYEFINLGHEIPAALREASKQLVENGDQTETKLPEYDTSAAVAQTIAEDEEMAEDELEPEQQAELQHPVAVSEHSKYDPRVPSGVDPPGAAYRIKLVCTLLEVSSRQLVTKANLSAIDLFLAALQRYLFTKPVLATEVEFSLLDMFDAIDSQWKKAGKASGSADGGGGFTRYNSWLDSHNATVAAEEAEAVDLSKKRSDLEAIAVADSSKSLEDIMTRMIDQNLDEDSVSHMDDEEEDGSLVFSAKGSVHSHPEETDSEDEDNSGHSEDDLDEEEEYLDSDNDGDSEEVGSEEEEFDEDAYARQLEEEAFERELRRITMDALEKGKSSSRKVVASDMITGSQVVKKKEPSQARTETEQPPVPTFLSSRKAGVSVQLLRKGNKGKVEAKELVVPMETNLAIAATKKDAAAARERDEIKLRVLQYEADSAEAELTGGNVYLEQEKLQVIRNKPLSMDDIDRNFGTTRGDLQQANAKAKPTNSPMTTRVGVRPNRGGPGRGRGQRGGRSSGRGLV
uniref:MIF4G domain-containing protein n=2 Tax=Entomoneis paludosa TaxID=265537 RepID=A0A7S2Y6I1_9STRA|mmetsp:Transcript_17843/g.36906  ORF Transcript_17843/g.36906 Transcript_17843/m.36906 type:complete len:614 (+) Transcript_17843:298-2139(+)